MPAQQTAVQPRINKKIYSQPKSSLRNALVLKIKDMDGTSVKALFQTPRLLNAY
jgi:hypothetical protein